MNLSVQEYVIHIKINTVECHDLQAAEKGHIFCVIGNFYYFCDEIPRGELPREDAVAETKIKGVYSRFILGLSK